MAWWWLLGAGLLEVGWALGLKWSDGFSRPLPSVLTAFAMIGSLWLLGLATKTLPLSTAYAVWVGIGTVGAVVGGVALLGEPLGAGRALFLVLLVVALVGLKLTSPA